MTEASSSRNQAAVDNERKAGTSKAARQAETSAEAASAQTACRKAIQERLKLSAMNSGDAMIALCKAETGQLPQKLTADQLLRVGARPSNSTCCFDLASPPSWTASKICQRCSAVLHVMQLPSNGSASSMKDSMLGSALLTTSCESQLERKGVMPTLPNEIVEMIVSAWVYQFRPVFKDSGGVNHATLVEKWSTPNANASIRALMHTSHLARTTVTKHFPARLPSCCHFRSALESTLQGHHTDVHQALDAFVRAAVRFYLLDMSQKAAHPLVMPECTDSMLTQGSVKVHSVKVSVYAPEDRMRLSWSEVQNGKQGHAQKQVSKDAPQLTVSDACQAIAEAFNNALPAPYVANPYYRALQWRNKVDPPVSLAVKLELAGWVFDGANPSNKVWIFDQHRRTGPCPFEGI